MSIEISHTAELDQLVDRACEIGHQLHGEFGPALGAAALLTEAADVYEAMRALTGRPKSIAPEALETQDLGGGLLDIAGMPIRTTASPEKVIFFRAKDRFTLDCGDREAPTSTYQRDAPLRGQIAGRTPNTVGRATLKYWNVSLALGAMPRAEEAAARGLTPYEISHGGHNMRAGLRWLTGQPLHGSRHEIFHEVSGLLANVILVPSESCADIQRSPGLHPSRWPADPETKESAAIEEELSALLETARAEGVGADGYMTANEIADLADVSPKVIAGLRASLPEDSPLLASVPIERTFEDGRVTAGHYNPGFVSWVLRQILLK